MEKVLENRKFYRKMTMDLLEIIPQDNLNFTIGKNMGTLGKQYRHIGDVQHCYTQAILTQKINFNAYIRDYSIEGSTIKIQSFLEEIDKEMYKIVGKINNPEFFIIDWGFEKLNLIEHINELIHHEILHHGELIVYIRTLGLQFPESWSAWGL